MLHNPVFNPSAQQAAFLDWCQFGSGSCILEAVAGSGKTTVLLQAAVRIPGTVVMMAYNKKIGDELTNRLRAMGVDWTKARAGTVHGLCYGALKKTYPHLASNAAIQGSKVNDIAEQMFPVGSRYQHLIALFCKAVSMAKQQGFGVLSDMGDIQNWIDIVDHYDLELFGDGEEFDADEQVARIRACIALLKNSNADLSRIDFDDMIYLALLLNVRFFQYDVVMIDEAQDTNAVRREAARRMLKRGGRIIAVGDRHQAIYGFTGADNDSLDLIRRQFGCIDMPMTNTYRCPTSVVAFAQQWVSHIQSVEGAAEGSISSMVLDDFLADAKAKERELTTAAILCRNTKPLVSLAFALIRQRVACKIEGRDIAANLIKTAKRWKSIKTLSALSDKLDDHLERSRIKYKSPKFSLKLQTIEDTVETLKTIIDQCISEGATLVSDLVIYVEGLFADNVDKMLTLSTIHKSKGREWNTVYWLDRNGTCPSKYAIQDWQKEQEQNLQYVAATRAKQALVELIKTPKKED